MPSAAEQPLSEALAELIEFAQKLGIRETSPEVGELRGLVREMAVGTRIPPGRVYDARSKLAFLLETILCEVDGTRKPRKRSPINRLFVILDNIDDKIYPPKFTEKELDASSFKGGKDVGDPIVRYMGSKRDVQRIFESSLSILKSYSSAIVAGEMDKAYSQTSEELKNLQSLEKFVKLHEKASQKYGGRPTAYQVERFGWIFPDQEARNNKEVARLVWPKSVPVSTRRSTVHGFWVRDTVAKNGCYGSHWIVETAAGFRVAKFDFFLQ